MTRSVSDEEADVGRILDKLGITPEYLRGIPNDIGLEAVSTVDTIEPTLVPPPKVRWPVSLLWQIDLDKFNRDLQGALNALSPLGGLPVGYCYMIRRKGQVVHVESKPWAQLPNDPQTGEGSVAWDPDIPMNVASVSKFVTAIGVVKLLQSRDIALNASITGYLPQYWTQHSSVSAITFRQLLRHEAGLGSSLADDDTGPGDFAEAKMEIQAGSNGPLIGTYKYKNVNYAILRVLFATLTGSVSPASKVPPLLAAFGISDDSLWNGVSEMVYCNYVNKNVFAPAGIAPRQLKADDNAALAYATPPSVPGARIENVGLSGPGGWHLSINELVHLLYKFRTGSIISRRRAQQLLTNMYGLGPPITTNAGPVYCKGGGLRTNGGQGVASMICLMPGAIEFAIFANSWDGTKDGPLRMIPDLINNSTKFIVW